MNDTANDGLRRGAVAASFLLGMVLGNAEARILPKDLPWLAARVALELLHVAWVVFAFVMMLRAYRDYTVASAKLDEEQAKLRKEIEERQALRDAAGKRVWS